MSAEFDLAVIGAGAAGLAAARGSARLGARTALIESQRVGGVGNWSGCVPSKALLKAAQVAHHMRSANRFGIASREPEVDLMALMRRVHAIRQQVDESRDPLHGVKIFPARARFTGPHTLQLSTGQQIESRYFLIAAGSRPLLPKVEGIDLVPYVTCESVFEMTRLPKRLIVVGAGPCGVEMAQAFERLGSAVTLAEAGHRVLSRDDSELAYLLENSLRDEGVDIRFGATVEKIAPGIVATLGTGARLEADAILFATGRRVDVSDLDLRSAGIRVTEYGVAVDERCRTAVKHIYAAGDVTGRHPFTHMGEHMAEVAVENALLGSRKTIARNATWCTYSDPELACTGESEDHLKNRNIRFEVYKFPFARLDRAVSESEGAGLIKVFATPRKGEILGAAILGSRAGEMIAELALAIEAGLTLADIASTIHPYPTYMSGNRRIAEVWQSTRRRSIMAGARRLLRR